MRYYDYKKAKALIEAHQHEITSASLGVAEDWFWTATTVWENGEWKHELFLGDVEAHHKAYFDELKYQLEGVTDGSARIDIRSAVAKSHGQHEISGLCGSSWATPTLLLTFANEVEKKYDVFFGEKSGEEHPGATSGCFSAPARTYMESVPKGE